MKGSELMIGDWVYVNGLTQQVFDLAYNQNEKELTIGVLDPQGEVYQCFYGFDHVEPIPLTLEILQKNGFETDGEAIWASFCLEDKEFALEISEPNYYDENYGERGYWWTINACEYSIIPLRYVHELQHAIRLCGIEKEIEL